MTHRTGNRCRVLLLAMLIAGVAGCAGWNAPPAYVPPASMGGPVMRGQQSPRNYWNTYPYQDPSAANSNENRDGNPVRPANTTQPPAASGNLSPPVYQPAPNPGGNQTPGSSQHTRGPLTPSGAPLPQYPGDRTLPASNNYGQPTSQPAAQPPHNVLPPSVNGGPPVGGGAGGGVPGKAPGSSDLPMLNSPFLQSPGDNPWGFDPFNGPIRTAPIDVSVEEARTGRFMFGVGVNSDAGVTGQVIIDERNFDFTRVPTSFDDILNGRAFRGAGQGFRIEAVPGDQVQRYLVSFTEPYLLNTPISLNLSGFLFDRRYRDWDEQRLGGRATVGYRLTHDLSIAGTFRGEQVDIHDPRFVGVPELDAVLGESDIFSGRVALTHDTRDMPFAPTEGHLIELSYEQVFGDFDYPRGEIDYRRYFLIRERPDGSGRHTVALSLGVGFSGAQTPIFENYFAGGFSTLRGFDFRGASPVSGGVIVGGEFRFLGSLEYLFPLTADDMIKGVVFCDFGTVEQEIEISGDDFRVAPGVGVRISIPALGPAPLALDLAFPILHADTDDLQNFSFFFGFGRG